jgi:HD superfamily phosphohydrolase
MRKKLLRDAVHGDIELEALEVELIDTPEFQRLRGIRQLGTAHLVYPSAMHSRFEHSIGTLWMAWRMIEAVRRTNSIPPEEMAAIRIAALLHDVTHIPFGHTLEDERRVLPRHDSDPARFRHFFHQSTVAAVLNRSGCHDRVLDILAGRAGFASDIIAGAITADLLDYLRRDTYFAGFSQYYDPRIFQSFTMNENRLVVDLEKNGMLRRDTLSELINLLRIRYTLSERVYFHHAKIASGAMVSKAVELALQSGLPVEDLWEHRDDTLFWVLRGRFAGHPAVTHLLRCLDSRQLYRACCVMSLEIGEDRQKEIVETYHSGAGQREELESEIARGAGLESHQIIVYCPSLGMSLPEAEALVRMPGGAVQPLSESNNEEIRVLKDKHRALWKFYVLADRTASDRYSRVAAAARHFLNL